MIGVIMIFLQVLIGGITRLTESGLSITEWNVVMGTLPPMNDAEWKKSFDEYKQSPQGKLLNTDMTVSGYKNIFWWEWIHRLWARTFFPVFLIPFIYFLLKKMIEKKLIWKLLFVFVFGGVQGVLGWYMVSSGLKDVPWVSPYFLCAHLLLASALMGYLLWLSIEQFDAGKTEPQVQNKTTQILGRSILAIVFIQLGFGAFMAGGVAPAALWYPTWPRIGMNWIPENVFLLSNPQWHTLLENPAFVQLVHRCIAYLLVILIFTFWLRSRKNFSGDIRIVSNGLLAMIFIQATLGIITLLSSIGSVPVLWGVLHQAGGLITFSLALILVYFLSKKKIYR